MSITSLSVLIHVFAAFGTVAGILGRELTSAQLSKSADLPTFLTLSQLVGRFDERFVRPTSMVLFVSGILLAVLEGYPLFGFLQSGSVNWLLVANLFVLSIVGLIIFVFVPHGKQYAQALDESKAQGQITPALHEALANPVVMWAHRWENFAIAMVIVLMVSKPF